MTGSGGWTFPRTTVRRTRYKGRDGWLVRHYQYRGQGKHAPGVFVETLRDAEDCRAAFKAGGEITYRDGRWRALESKDVGYARAASISDLIDEIAEVLHGPHLR